MPVTASVATGTANAARMTRAMNEAENPGYVFTGNMNTARAPEYFVRIFNVSDVEQRIERPWVNFNPGQGGKIIVIAAKPPEARYGKPFLIADIVQMPIRSITTGEMHSTGQSGKFLAQDALNPEDPTGNWKTVRPMNATQHSNEGTNLYHWGLFWTIAETPADDEVDAAVSRLEVNYNRLIEEAKGFWMGGNEMRKQIGNTHRRAAQYYGLEFEWNQVYKLTVECEGCGTRISEKAVICPTCSAVRNWQKALSLGLRTPAQASEAGILLGQAQSMAPAAPRRGRRAE